MSDRSFVLRSYFILFAVLLLLPLRARADEEADHNALRAIRAMYEDALNNNDLAKIKPLLADGFTGVMISGEELKSFEDLQVFWKKVRNLIGPGGSYHVKVITDRTDIFGDIGVSRGYNEEVFHTSGGKTFEFRAPWTAVTRRQNGEWKIFRVHAALNPMDNVIITEIVRQAKLLFGLSGLAIGLVAGVIVRSLWRKKIAPRPLPT